ncbi:hypothetical protein [Methylocucumis oryzae]|uniref:hypothetical protein n=1 Tax=Methylocucumis oryzae TaxID=1632867 RepID=UPI00178CF5C4|nr:hypothetical protein [Methylocucumis oryzae]
MLTAHEISQSLAIFQHLSALSRHCHFKPIKTAVYCWWSEDAGHVSLLAQDCIEQTTECVLQASHSIAANHNEIIRDAGVLAALSALCTKLAD